MPHHPRPWWKPAVLFASAGAALGAVAGVLIGGAAAAVPFAVWTSALLVNAWALNGGEP